MAGAARGAVVRIMGLHWPRMDSTSGDTGKIKALAWLTKLVANKAS